MTSLTTLFVVGPEEYVEFNESMGSKAFLEHIWDQKISPLKREDTSAIGTQLHSAGARISDTPPPKIEFPTILRVRGRGSKYQPTGKYITWDELKRRNPIAVKDPPSMDSFIEAGAQVGTAERLEAGALLKGEKRFKIAKRAKGEVRESQEGWFGGEDDGGGEAGGAAESIYAHSDPEPRPSTSHGKVEASAKSEISSDAKVTGGAQHLAMPTDDQTSTTRTLRKSRSGLSLSARLGMGGTATRSPDTASTAEPRGASAHVSQDRAQRPHQLQLSTNNRDLQSSSSQPTAGPSVSTPIAQMPLSSTHPPPETPMKHNEGTAPYEILPTPRTESLLANQAAGGLFERAGLMLDPGDVALVSPADPGNSAAPGSSSLALQAAGPEPKAQANIPARPARSQLDDMLAKVRQARTGFSSSSTAGSSESMWAPKEATQVEAKAKLPAVEREVKREAKPQRNEAPPTAQPEKVASLVSRLGPKVDSAEAIVDSENDKKRENSAERSATAAPAPDLSPSSEGQRAVATPSSSAAGQALPEGATIVKEEAVQEDRAAETTVSVDENSTLDDKEVTDNTPLQEEVLLGGAVVEGTAPSSGEEAHADTTNDTTAETVLGPCEVDQTTALDLDAPTQDISSSPPISLATDEGGKSVESDQWSHIGHDTMSSINWDDDDDSLPDLPEEWTKGMTLSPTPTAVVSAARSTGGGSVMSNEHDGREFGTREAATTGGRGAKRGGKGRAGKQRNADAASGVQIAGRAGGGNAGKHVDAATLSAVSPWERRAGGATSGGHTSTSPPKAGLGLRIAGSAGATGKAAGSSDRRGGSLADRLAPAKATRELFPDSQQKRGKESNGNQASSNGSRWALPPNAKPLDTTLHAAPAAGAKQHGRPRVSTQNDGGLFARLSQGTVAGAKATGHASNAPSTSERKDGDAAEKKGRAKGHGGGGGGGRRK